MHRTTLYLDEDLRRRVRALAQATNRTQARVIREALLAYTSAGRAAPRSLGMGASGAGDVADRAEELLTGFGEDEPRARAPRRARRG
jgi:predicted transcriptional regulator